MKPKSAKNALVVDFKVNIYEPSESSRVGQTNPWHTIARASRPAALPRTLELSLALHSLGLTPRRLLVPWPRTPYPSLAPRTLVLHPIAWVSRPTTWHHAPQPPLMPHSLGLTPRRLALCPATWVPLPAALDSHSAAGPCAPQPRPHAS